MLSIAKNLFISACLATLCTSSSFGTEPEHSPSPSPTTSPSPTPPGGDDHGGGSNSNHGDLSLHGLYEGTTSGGGIGLFYIDTNTHIQINVFDITGQTIGFAEGQITNGAFSFTLSNGQSINGHATEHTISGTIGTVTFQASRAAEFGSDHNAIGRFIGVAQGPGGESRVMFVIDTSGHIALLQTSGTAPNLVRTGGFGTVTPPASSTSPYTFTLNFAVGSSSPITGSFTIVDDVFQGTFTNSAGTFTVNSFKTTLVNRMANISTRGLVGQGQGQLIGGFIITGGPKTVLIRAIGPSLAAFGVTPVLDNPAIKLYANSTILAQNDDWRTNTNATDISASGLAPTNDLEASLLVRLEPGAYTTVVSGSDTSATGIALVEVYEVDHD